MNILTDNEPRILTQFQPVKFIHKDGHERTVHTQEALDRFFDNRNPFEWEMSK